MVCRECGFNRRYCTDACAAAARAKSIRAAQRTYRRSPEGREQHREEEHGRRARRRQVRVGDHILRLGVAGGSVGGVTAPKLTVVDDARVVADTAVAAPARRGPWPLPTLAQWRLVVGHALAARAHELRRRGEPVPCACCGRRGRVVAVVVRTDLGWTRGPDEDGG